MAKAGYRESVSSNVVRLLRETREAKQLSMTRVAEKAGVSQGMISLFEHELRNPSLDTLLRICDALDVDLSEILAKAERAARQGRK